MKFPFFLLGVFFLQISVVHAANIAVTSGAPAANADAVGNGTWAFNNHTGTWNLTSTTGSQPGQGFTNGGLAGGANGLEHTTNHTWANTTGTGNSNPQNNPPAINNSITFSWTGNAGHYIRLSQSPYNSGAGWNGGSSDTGNQFTLTWAGGAARVGDPSNQLDDSTTGVDDFPVVTTIGSGTAVRQPVSPNQSRNNSDDWYIDLPVGVTSVTVDWTYYDSDNQVHQLLNEWIAFDILPEPSRAMLLLMGGGAMILRRRRSS